MERNLRGRRSNQADWSTREDLEGKPPGLGGSEAHVVEGVAAAPPAAPGAPLALAPRRQLPAVGDRPGAALVLGRGNVEEQHEEEEQNPTPRPGHYREQSGWWVGGRSASGSY